MGNLGGLSGADVDCQSLATGANLPGTYKAWLSDATTSAASRLTQSTDPYVFVSGAVVASSWTALTTQGVGIPLDEDELGTAVTTDLNAWTNTNADGSVILDDTGQTCGDWQVVGNDAAMLGSANETGETWTNANLIDLCMNPHRLYCMQQ
jgi:hypothetical protein